jgi:3-oxoacyl-[acyl-carrier-protein] synthase-1
MQRCLVVAVDSYVDLDAMDWLGSKRRLKCDDNPVGLSPGEAASAFLVESSRAATNRGANVEAWVRAVSIVDTKRPESADVQTRDGSILSDAIAVVLPADKPFRGDLIADLNGEEWRARELGGALARLGAALGDVRFVYPAASVGETGASSAAVGLCLAARAFRRKYAKSNASLVVSLSDAGEAAGIRIEAPV